MDDVVVVRYGEIFLKSEYVRRKFKDLLARNILYKLGANGLEAELTHSRHRIFLITSKPRACARLTCEVFGVSSTSPAKRTESEIGNLEEYTARYAGENVGSAKTFACRVKRLDYPIDSQTLESRIGARIQKLTKLKVDLTDPDLKVEVDIRSDTAYVFHERLKGLGGLPYGSQKSLAATVNSPLDVLACWLMMGRGCKINPCGVSQYLDHLSKYADASYKTYQSLDEALTQPDVYGRVSSDLVEKITHPRRSPPTYYPLCLLTPDQINQLRILAKI